MGIRSEVRPILGGEFQMFFGILTPIFWGKDPIGLAHVYQMGWFNHHLSWLIETST